MIKEQLEKISQNIDLGRNEAVTVLQMIIDNQLTATEIGAFLYGLHVKGESVDEIQGFIDTMQRNMIKVNLDDPDAIDVCGTGGDNKHSFNVSTAAAIVIAAGDVTVAKHGNRAVSSKTGSADVLEALGVRIDLSPEKTRQCINEIGIGFFFAPLYHPAMKAIVPHRKNLGIRTVFNILGPLINPAFVKRQLIGTFNAKTAEKMAAVLHQRGYLKACIVHSDDGFDEISPFANSWIYEVNIKYSNIKKYDFLPDELVNSQSSDLTVHGGNSEENARILLSVLNGKKDIHRDMTILNAAFGLYVAEKVNCIKDGVILATDLIDSGLALRKLQDYINISQKLAN